MAALQPEAGCGSAEVDSVSSAGDHRLPAIVGCHSHSHGSEPFLYGSKKFLALLEFSAYGACHRFAREIILSGAESSADEDEARLALQGGDNRIAYSPQVVGDTDCVRYSQANIQGLLSEEDLIRVDYVAAQQMIFTGDELLRGDIVNTNQVFLGEESLDIGLRVTHAVSVADDLWTIRDAVVSALEREPGLILVSGGLGPTQDDLTREAVASAVGRELQERKELLTAIQERFR